MCIYNTHRFQEPIFRLFSNEQTSVKLTTVENNNNLLNTNIFSRLGYESDSDDEQITFGSFEPVKEIRKESTELAIALEEKSDSATDQLAVEIVVEKMPKKTATIKYNPEGATIQLYMGADGQIKMSTTSLYDIPPTSVIDDNLPKEGSRFKFKAALSADVIRKSLNSDFPRSAFAISMRPDLDRRLTSVIITKIPLPDPTKISEWLKSAKDGGRNFVDFISASSDDDIKQWFTNNWSDTDFGFRIRDVTDRLCSVRLFEKKNSLPSKSKLEELFSRSKTEAGKSPVAHLIVKRELINEKTRIVYGYKFIFSKSQPTDLDLVSITVFQQDDRSKAGTSKIAKATKDAKA